MGPTPTEIHTALRKAKEIFKIGEFNPYNGVTDGMCHVYLAKDLEHIGGTPDETEEFEIILQTPADIEEQIRTGVIWDGMTIAGWSIAKGRM
jgi:hypothetical protein